MNDVRTALPFLYPNRDPKVYQSGQTDSFYIESFDGTRIAVDITLPVREGNQKLPAIIMVTRDHRRNKQDFETAMGEKFVEAGFAHIIVELRGCGVSFGINDSFCDENHCRDLLAVVNFAEKQDWSNGKIGLYGCSNRAFIQLCTGALAPTNITAITPVVAVQDFYYQNYPNGVSACPNFRIPKPPVIPSKEEFLKVAAPIDEDPDGTLAYQAFSKDQWPHNLNFFETLVFPGMKRDTEHPLYKNEKTNMTIPPYGKLDAFYRTGVKQHQFIGELESGTLGQLALQLDFGGTVCLGPWTHGGAILGQSPYPNGNYDVPEAYVYWYDFSLKEKENGFNQAPPVSYYVINAPKDREWRYSECWPPENESRMTFYLSSETSGTSASCNDGTLSQTKPNDEITITYQVRDDITVFPDENGVSHYNRAELYWDGDMEPSVDSKGLTFTSAPLFPFYQNEFAGCISANLWISCDQNDVDLIVYAEEVFADGTSHYIKDGVMRASHRTTGPNPSWEKMGAFWHTSMTADVENCLKEGLSRPTLLQFAVDPTCYHFRGGSRVRFTITCANPQTFQHTMYETGNLPILTLYTGGEHASNISVPFLDPTYQAYVGVCESKEAALYRFENYCYVFREGRWFRYLSEHLHQVDGSVLLLPDGTIFQQYGAPEAYPSACLTAVNKDNAHPTALYAREIVSVEPIEHRDYTLFVPGTKTLYLDLFRRPSDEPVPCVVFIHGYGAPYSYLPKQLLKLYEDGFAIASLEVRNYPPNQFPDYLQDAKGGIRYLRAHAEEFGIDPERIGSYGFSLGGNTSLMIALTGDDPELEGTVGGNTEYSSRVQAAACGFAWSDLIHMGSDMGAEEASTPALTARRVAMTDGEQAPSCEVIGFAGPGKGLKNLRDYSENPTGDTYLDEKVAQARYVSPVNHVTPSVPPIALFGGYGDDGVNIAFRQSLRTFNALESVGAESYLYGNTLGKYGENEEVQMGIHAFFHKKLSGSNQNHKLVFLADQDLFTADYVSRRLSVPASQKEGMFLVSETDMLPYLSSMKNPAYHTEKNNLDVLSLTGDNVRVKLYDAHKAIVITWKEGE